MATLFRRMCIPLVALLLLLGAGQVRGQEATGTIQIIQGGTGHGTITSRPAGIDCTITDAGATGRCSAIFPAGTKVRLKAEAAANSKFEGWAPVSSCLKPNITVEAGRTHECQPVFSFTEPPELLLQVGIVGSGRITSSPEGIDCIRDEDLGTLSGQCGATFPNGSTVVLTAAPLAGWTFVEWSGDDRDCEDGTVVLDSAMRCTATFVRATG